MPEKKSFEQSLKRLDEIVLLLENGNTDLDGSLKLFSEGAALLADCGRTLDQAELVIEKLFPAVQEEDNDD